MPITVQGAARSKLNLPPLRPIDGGKTVDGPELDRFTRAIQEWGVQVDRMNEGQDGELDAIRARLDALEGIVRPWTKMATTTANGSTASTTYVNWPTTTPLVMTFNKREANTDLQLYLASGYYPSVANVVQTLAVNIEGTDYQVINSARNSTNHDQNVGGVQVAGLPSGLLTLTLRAKVNPVTPHTLTCDANDTTTLTVTEVPIGP